jgi:uncharacterized protein
MIETQGRPDADFQAALAHERQISPSLDGRTVFDDRKPPAKTAGAKHKQLKLF